MEFTILKDELERLEMLNSFKSLMGYDKKKMSELKLILSIYDSSLKLPTSTQLLSDCKDKFKELEGKGNLDYRSYSNSSRTLHHKFGIQTSTW